MLLLSQFFAEKLSTTFLTVTSVLNFLLILIVYGYELKRGFKVVVDGDTGSLKYIYKKNLDKILSLPPSETHKYTPFQQYELTQYTLSYNQQMKSIIIELRKYVSIAESKINHRVMPNSRKLGIIQKSSMLFTPKEDKNKNLNQEFQPIERYNSNQETLCLICYVNKPNVLNNPCGHCCVCRECLDLLMGRYVARGDDLASKKVKNKGQECPMCRDKVSHAIVFKQVLKGEEKEFWEIETIDFNEEEEMKKAQTQAQVNMGTNYPMF